MKSLLLLHGALGCKKQFNGLIDRLSASFDVHSIDFDGHGGSPTDIAFTMDRFGDNVESYLASQNLKNIAVFGYSMGGYVALSLAIKKPELFSEIVTLGTKFHWTPEIAQREIRMLNPSKIEEKIPQFAQYLNDLHRPADWKQVMEKTAEMMIDLGTSNSPTPNGISNVRLPVTIGLGDQDNMVTVEESKYAAQQLPNGRFVQLQNTPHPIAQVNVETLTEYILDHVS
ncbi:MAG: alpha/beta hydrolase [Bacteroidia bacterium]|nr:alpha/beta hydrolase [Bacteroidia bacterium]